MREGILEEVGGETQQGEGEGVRQRGEGGGEGDRQPQARVVGREAWGAGAGHRRRGEAGPGGRASSRGGEAEAVTWRGGSPDPNLPVLLHLLDISLELCSSVLEPRYHLIKNLN